MPICPVAKIDLENLNPYEITPSDNLIWVKLPKMEDKTEGGIFIPKDSEEPPNVGSVISIGKNVYDVIPGDVILFSKYSPGDEYVYRSNTFKFINVNDVIGTVQI